MDLAAGSGGGAIHIIYKNTITNSSKITCTGGTGGYRGGNGTVNLVKM